MAMLQEKDRKEVQKQLGNMQRPVRLVYFTQKFECEYCSETRQLLEEVASLSDKITLQVYDFVEDKEQVQRYKIDKIPATVILGDRDYGIRFYGIPAGYEFATLLQDLLMVSRRDSNLNADSRKMLKELTEPLHIQVFVTPTCPYCPRAVYLAHQFALESDKVTADMVEATEFPHLSQRYGVMGVPKTVVNDQPAVEGALPESHFLEHILTAVKATQAK